MNTNYSLEDIAYLTVDEKTAEMETQQKGKAFVAVAAAMIWPGLGHLISGHTKWAAVWFGLWTFLCLTLLCTLFEPQLLYTAIVLLPLGILVQIFQMLHAGRCGRMSRSSMFGEASARFLIGSVLALLSLGECYGSIRYLQSNWFEVCYTPTPSMSPNLVSGDLFLNLTQQSFARWDIVGVNVPSSRGSEIRRLCKRVVGLPGEKVEITGAGLLINDKLTQIPPRVGPYAAVDTSYTPLLDAEPLAAANGCWGRPITLGADEYFLLGDNTAISDDARFWPSIDDRQPGATPRSHIFGRIVAIVWPPGRWQVFQQHTGDTHAADTAAH